MRTVQLGMTEIKFQNIQQEIKNKNAKWEARDHAFLKLNADELIKRLGVQMTPERLSELRSVVKPDISKFIESHENFDMTKFTEFSKMPENRVALPFLNTIFLPKWYCWFGRLPRSVDWRNHNGRNNVTSVKDQGGCGSCVSFGTTATLESMVLIEHNVGLDLSEAELLFCGGGSCGGWWPDPAVNYLLSHGVSQESCFPYQAHNMTCTTCSDRNGEAIQIKNHVTLWTMADRKRYLSCTGPMMCVFEVFQDFFGYGTGVYSHVTGSSVGYHCVEVIGFDDAAGCWICKNSWGPGWGDGGFFRIAYGQCQIDTSFPFWGISGTKWFSP